MLQDDFGPDSDGDVLVEFDREYIPGLLGMARMERELSTILNYPVDLHTPGDLSRYFRNNVIVVQLKPSSSRTPTIRSR